MMQYSELFDVNKLRLARPCKASWDEMAGDEQVRSCSLCARSVYDLSAMSQEEASGLMFRTQGSACVKFYRRADGRIKFDDCPPPLRGMRNRLRTIASAVISAIAALTYGMGAFARDEAPAEQHSEQLPTVNPSDFLAGLKINWTLSESGPTDKRQWRQIRIFRQSQPRRLAQLGVPDSLAISHALFNTESQTKELPTEWSAADQFNIALALSGDKKYRDADKAFELALDEAATKDCDPNLRRTIVLEYEKNLRHIKGKRKAAIAASDYRIKIRAIAGKF